MLSVQRWTTLAGSEEFMKNDSGIRPQAYGTNAIPQGRSPTMIFFFTDLLATSMIDTAFDGPFAVNSVLPSGEIAIPHGRSPASIAATASLVLVSMNSTFLPRPVVM